MSSSNGNAQTLEILYSIIESIIQDKKPTENKLEDFNCKWSPEAIAAFTNLLFSHLKTTSTDLEAFAKHSKRSTVNSDDVKLLTRRNESLERNISEFIAKSTRKD